eukprot:gnl/Chilomastix_caulleri/6310.p1 GENE.gnl/Chilomastix_caulleri/6310~~gnl/Chilomastix_caulleri/6310.p1  ORF type:complete len:78 (+),score=9.10 gnl/Chilomastix_caulleri/6310:108-341(+)
MDVVHIRKTGEHFRLVYDPKGRFHLVSITPKQAETKLCRVKKYVSGSKGFLILLLMMDVLSALLIQRLDQEIQLKLI